jgi:putative transposase
VAHVYYRHFTHLVWSTWDRAPLLEEEIERKAYALIRAQCTRMKVTVYALGGVADYVHLLVSLPRTLCLADFMEAVKGISSKVLNNTHGTATWAFKWQGSYSAHSVSASHMTRVRLYIENQKQHHADNLLWPSCEPPPKLSVNTASPARAGGELHF